jgi:hypothetical protein
MFMDTGSIQRDFDLVEIPLEGVAAYWLSLKKLVDGKRNFKALEEEAEYTSEPYVQYLLHIGFGKLAEGQVRHLAGIRREAMLEELARKLDLMRMALLDMAAGDNPRKTLAKMTARFHRPPLNEEKAFQFAQELMKLAGSNTDKTSYFVVGHRLRPDKLMVVLLFYVLWARREGKMACQPFLQHVGSQFFGDGMALVIDGFDAPFVRKRLRVHRDAILADVRRKMEMSTEMCLGVRNKLTYDDTFSIAKAYMF